MACTDVKETTSALFLSIEVVVRDCLKTLITQHQNQKVTLSRRSLVVKMLSFNTTAKFENDNTKEIHVIVESVLRGVIHMPVHGWKNLNNQPKNLHNILKAYI